MRYLVNIPDLYVGYLVFNFDVEICAGSWNAFQIWKFIWRTVSVIKRDLHSKKVNSETLSWVSVSKKNYYIKNSRQ